MERVEKQKCEAACLVLPELKKVGFVKTKTYYTTCYEGKLTKAVEGRFVGLGMECLYDKDTNETRIRFGLWKPYSSYLKVCDMIGLLCLFYVIYTYILYKLNV